MDFRGSLYLELARRFRSRGIKVLCSRDDEKALIEDDASNLGADGNFATCPYRKFHLNRNSSGYENCYRIDALK